VSSSVTPSREDWEDRIASDRIGSGRDGSGVEWTAGSSGRRSRAEEGRRRVPAEFAFPANPGRAHSSLCWATAERSRGGSIHRVGHRQKLGARRHLPGKTFPVRDVSRSGDPRPLSCHHSRGLRLRLRLAPAPRAPGDCLRPQLHGRYKSFLLGSGAGWDLGAAGTLWLSPAARATAAWSWHPPARGSCGEGAYPEPCAREPRSLES
jgi:hypothetical protein